MPRDDGAGARAPMDVIETSRKRSAEDAGHETDEAVRGGGQPDPGSVADDSMQEAMRDAEALELMLMHCELVRLVMRGDGSALGMGSGARG